MTANEIRLAAPAMRRSWLGPASLALLWLVLAAVLSIAIAAPLKDDIAWLLHLAQAMLRGEHLYSDIVEINPPLIIWIMAVPAFLARLTGASPEILAILLFAAVVLACAGWSARILRGYAPRFASPAPVFAVIGAVLLLAPGVEFGQREHLLTAFALPYLCLLARRLRGRAPARAEAVAAGLLAGMSMALKPYYGIALALVELVAARSGLRPWRAEPLAAILLLLGYGGAVVVLYPAYLHLVVPLALALYGASDVPLLTLFVNSRSLLAGQAVMLLLLLAPSRPRRRDPLFLVVAVFALGATLACFLQGKAWFYHRLPATIATALALVAWLAAASTEPGGDGRHRRLLPVLVAAVVGGFGLAAGNRLLQQIDLALHADSSLQRRIERLIEARQARRYLAFSQSLSPGFPVVNETGVAWASRFDSMWALRGVLWRERTGAAPVAWPVRQWIVADFLARCPDLVAVDDRDGIDYPGALAAAPAFAAAWSRYRPIAAFDGLRLFARTGPGCG